MIKSLPLSGWVDIDDAAAGEAHVRSREFNILIELMKSEYLALGKEIENAGLMDKHSDETPLIKPIHNTSIPKDRQDRYGEVIALTDQFCQGLVLQ